MGIVDAIDDRPQTRLATILGYSNTTGKCCNARVQFTLKLECQISSPHGKASSVIGTSSKALIMNEVLTLLYMARENLEKM